MLPPTKHSIQTIDTQPIQSSAPQQSSASLNLTVNALLISVSGTVQYGTESYAHGFYHTFVIDKAPAAKANQQYHYIVYATFRSRVNDIATDTKSSSTGRGKAFR
jgi:hypothetical protein